MSQLLKQRYLLISKLGQGGMGAVYKAQDTNLGDRPVAVKEMIQRDLNPQEVMRASKAFKQEADMLARLHHPNLPSIHEHFEEAGYWYLVMEFIEGQTLEDYLKARGGKLLFKEVLDIGMQLCTVLDYLHTRQPPIIFRDLKPLNIMHAHEGHIYLIDFGIARHFKPGQARDTIVAYSKGFAAPEQYGEAQTTVQSDIYSLGAMLHYLLSGNHPARTPFRFAPLPSQGQPGLARLDTLIMQMVAIDGNARPASMAAVKQELQRVATEESQANKSTSIPPRSVYQPHPPVQVVAPPLREMRSSTSSSYPVGTKPVTRASDGKVNIWRIGKRQMVAMVPGALLFAGLSYLTNFLQLPSVGNVSIRPAIVIPLFFGVVFGPIVGFVSGGLGNFIGDLISGYSVYLNWDIGNGLIGFIAGLAGLGLFNTFGRYRSHRALTIAEILGAVGVVVGIAFAAYTDIWLSKLTFAGATNEFIPATVSDLIFGIILLPILLVAYNAAVGPQKSIDRDRQMH